MKKRKVLEITENIPDEEDYLETVEEFSDRALELLNVQSSGFPAIITHKEEVGDYPTENHKHCRVKATKDPSVREVAPEFNTTLIIREKR